ncbi:MAG: restriction endonuclease, partial [Deltaproteobacteria bacterium]|nr:restriction endonuclease [Deltaproteobacteria bacterium]
MAVPKYYELYKDILEALADGEVHTITELLDIVAVKKNISSEERSMYLKSGIRPVFDDRLSWAKTYLKAAGLVTFPKRGKTQISEEGRKVLAENPIVIDNKFLSRYESFRKFEEGNPKDSPKATNQVQEVEAVSKETSTELIDKAIADINSSLGDDLLSEIMNQNQQFFESLVKKLIIKMGYGAPLGEDTEELLTITEDGGFDGFIREDKLGFANIYIKAKRWNPDKTIEFPDMETFVGGITSENGKGLFITTAKFSKYVIQFARDNNIVLIDGKLLTSLMIEYG